MEQRERGRTASAGTFAATGAAFAVGIGYMDPGNWATDLDATRYGFALLWAVLLSGFAAVLLQVLVVRHAVAGGEDLAVAIARRWPRAARWLWPLYALAIIATEIAEFTGVVLGLQLVLHLPRGAAVAAAAGLFLALLLAGGTTARRFERFAIATTALLAIAYAFDCAILQPPLGAVAAGALLPSLPGPGAMLAVVGIVGATIMPHNLFLHGGLVLDRLRRAPAAERPRVERLAVKETALALGLATLVNGAILVVGATVKASTVESAFATLVPVAGNGSALLFGIALIAAGLAATASGACAGDIICHRDAPVRLSPLARRALAVGPAAALLASGASPTLLLLASQIALGLILPAVVVPLIALAAGGASQRTRGGLLLLASTTTVVVAALLCDGVLITSVFART